MSHEESQYPGDWFRIAEKDLRRVEYLLNIQDAEAAGFFLQQALEKSLKGFLLAHGWKLKRIHDLEALLNDALVHDPSLESFRSLCQYATTFYFMERYPLLVSTELQDRALRDPLQQAMGLFNHLRKKSEEAHTKK